MCVSYQFYICQLIAFNVHIQWRAIFSVCINTCTAVYYRGGWTRWFTCHPFYGAVCLCCCIISATNNMPLQCTAVPYHPRVPLSCVQLSVISVNHWPSRYNHTVGAVIIFIAIILYANLYPHAPRLLDGMDR